MQEVEALGQRSQVKSFVSKRLGGVMPGVQTQAHFGIGECPHSCVWRGSLTMCVEIHTVKVVCTRTIQAICLASYAVPLHTVLQLTFNSKCIHYA